MHFYSTKIFFYVLENVLVKSFSYEFIQGIGKNSKTWHQLCLGAKNAPAIPKKSGKN
jgi:hypothetical protein